MIFQADWPYYNLLNGKLYIRTRHGMKLAFFREPVPPRFADAAEAEAWLEANDIRGNVR